MNVKKKKQEIMFTHLRRYFFSTLFLGRSNVKRQFPSTKKSVDVS